MESKKRIKTKGLDPDKMMTKSYYARQEGISSTTVNWRINQGKIAVVIIKGLEVVHL